LLSALLATASALSAVAALGPAARRVALERAIDSPALAPTPSTAAPHVRRWLARLGDAWRPLPAFDRHSAERRLRAAGVPLSLPEAIGARRAATALGAFAGAILPRYGITLWWIVGAVIGFVGSGWLVSRRAARRRAQIDAELPQLLDLLATASQAGLGGPLALRRAVEATTGPLSSELQSVIDAVDLGGRWKDALRECAERLGIADLRRAVAALTRTEALGAPLADAMSELASRVREARRASATERARKAPVKMLFPLVLLILPAFLLLTVVPVLFSTIRSIS
jgi:tight adherence protein C